MRYFSIRQSFFVYSSTSEVEEYSHILDYMFSLEDSKGMKIQKKGLLIPVTN